MKIKRIGSVYLQADTPHLLKPALTYTKVWWRKDRYKKIRNEYPAYLINKEGNFLAGFENRVIRYCIKNSIPIEIEPLSLSNVLRVKPTFPDNITPMPE